MAAIDALEIVLRIGEGWLMNTLPSEEKHIVQPSKRLGPPNRLMVYLVARKEWNVSMRR